MCVHAGVRACECACWKEIAVPLGLLIIYEFLTPYNFAMCARHGANNHGVKVNDLGSNPDCDNCQKPPRIKQPQSMVVNVKLVALDNLQAASIPQSSEPNENKGGESVHGISGLF